MLDIAASAEELALLTILPGLAYLAAVASSYTEVLAITFPS